MTSMILTALDVMSEERKRKGRGKEEERKRKGRGKERKRKG